MASTGQQDEEIAEKLLHQLKHTQYACSMLTALSTRPGNFVYRGMLVTADGIIIDGQERTFDSIIIKHRSSSTMCQDSIVFEELLINSMTDSMHHDMAVRIPQLYWYDHEHDTQIFEDIRHAQSFMAMLSPSTLMNNREAMNIGQSLGAWLKYFHTWASAPQQKRTCEYMKQHDHMRKIKSRQTYDCIRKVLAAHPDLSEGQQQQIPDVSPLFVGEFEQPYQGAEEDWGLVHADLWSGNILVEDSSKALEGMKLYIIDWEFAQYGHRSTDLGQLIGDLYERKLVRGAEITTPILQGVIAGYSPVSLDTAMRTAIYVGVHLVSWDIRRPRSGPRVASTDLIRTVLQIGKQFIIQGLAGNVEYFRQTELKDLFTSH